MTMSNGLLCQKFNSQILGQPQTSSMALRGHSNAPQQTDKMRRLAQFLKAKAEENSPAEKIRSFGVAVRRPEIHRIRPRVCKTDVLFFFLENQKKKPNPEFGSSHSTRCFHTVRVELLQLLVSTVITTRN